MWDSRAEVETAPPSVTTAGAVIAQNAGLAHGVAWVIAATAGPDRWEAIRCSQFADVARWTWSHNSGRPTGNTWPLSNSMATSLTTETFIRALNIQLSHGRSEVPAAADVNIQTIRLSWPRKRFPRMSEGVRNPLVGLNTIPVGAPAMT